MGLFEYRDEYAKELHRDLIESTDGTEPCFDPYLVDPDSDRVYESHTDMWVENYTNRGVSQKEAEAMCAGCHVLEKCAAYAMYNGEPYGVWGGTTPKQRGFYRGKRIRKT